MKTESSPFHANQDLFLIQVLLLKRERMGRKKGRRRRGRKRERKRRRRKKGKKRREKERRK